MVRSGIPRSNALLPLLLIGVVVRALIPSGYMPGSLDSGVLFELCSDQLPPGFVIAGSGHDHHHHQSARHGKADNGLRGDCSFAHLVTGFTVAPELPLIALQRPVPENSQTPDDRILADAFAISSPGRGPPTTY